MTPWTPPGSLSTGILQARTLDWVAMPSPRGSSQPRDRTQVSHMEDSLLSEPPRKSMNTGVLPSPGDPPNSGIKLGSPVLEADSLPTKLQGKPKKLDTFQVQRQGNKYVFLPLLFNIILEVLVNVIKEGDQRVYKLGRNKQNLVVHMIVYVENLKKLKKKTLEINK